jgi:hypothetical protein
MKKEKKSDEIKGFFKLNDKKPKTSKKKESKTDKKETKTEKQEEVIETKKIEKKEEEIETKKIPGKKDEDYEISNDKFKIVLVNKIDQTNFLYINDEKKSDC